jgi:hypothetical protein
MPENAAEDSPVKGRPRFLPKGLVVASVVAACGWAASSTAEEKITAEQFDQLRRLIKPRPGESLWAQVPWLTNLKEARRRAAAEDKPLFLWRAGGGDVLGRA